MVVTEVPQKDELLTPAEVAELFKVHVKTVKNWSDEGILHPILTPGGRYRRYWKSEVEKYLEGGNESGENAR